MGLFDKLNKNDLLNKMKDSVESAANKAKEAVDQAKAVHEQKKAEQEQHRIEMEQLANEKARTIMDGIGSYSTGSSLFEGIDKDDLLKFTKEFYDKILMPANSVSQSKITMYPYFDDKQSAKIRVNLPVVGVDETFLIHLKAENKQDILITDKALYFSLTLPEDPKFFAKGSVPCTEISRITVAQNGNLFEFRCDDYILATFTVSKTTSEDFITLNTYFECIANKDFVITDEEVDRLIKTKIGEKVYAEVKKYLVYDDELMVYFAWGIDSLSAKDYVVCTTKQIIIVDREMLGATANIRQFYYEDITSASTMQNAKSNDLTVALIETAVTAATKTCDLVLSVSGAVIRINTLFKVEAERVVAVYHQYRKLSKTANAQPQVVVQQTQADPIEQIKKLKDLLDAGIITQGEFDKKKADILAKI